MQTKSMQVDAIVIGAGPAGSAAARLLAQAGWSVALVEKAEFPRRKVCGEFISAPTMPVLKACGIAAPFIAAAGPHQLRFPSQPLTVALLLTHQGTRPSHLQTDAG